ncbi:MAG: ATPase, T2SS/T4P/T4SS family [Candidatus Omnitrophica bacterium]|jgi:flagellar protein FlaI|nr:ATPase, T2SS/T4P/T4SS family [Candidatus Omnitrophota bacterium]
MERERITIENEILERLAGKIFLLQDLARKREIIFQTFLEVYNSASGQNLVSKLKNLDLEALFNEFLSYGVIDELLADPDVEDIMINYLSPIYVHKTKYGLVKTDKKFASREELDLFIKKLVIFSGRKTINKINNVELVEIKGRANIVYSPFGPQVTLTRAKERPLSIIELVENGTLNPEITAQLWLYVEGLKIKPANVIISGGPGTGKSTLLNALFSFIPHNDRIVVIEDTLELNTDLEENCSRLESDETTSLADLVKNSLRMRPDRIIVGEVRGQEAQDLMTAMNVGKYCMGTLHASTARETIIRLENEPMNSPEILVNLVDVFIIMRRYALNGKITRVVGELVETAGMTDKTILLSSLWTYDLGSATFRKSSVSSEYRDRLAQVSGKTTVAIMDEIKVRSNVIRLLIKQGIRGTKEVTEFCRKYSADAQAAIEGLGVKRQDLLK